MNFFITDKDPKISAKNLSKIHRNKMIVEYAQLLSSAHHALDEGRAIDNIYKLSHKNHPTSIWTRESASNYNRVLMELKELCRLYKEDTGKTHKTESKISILSTLPKNISNQVDYSHPPFVCDRKYTKYIMSFNIFTMYKQLLSAKYDDWKSRDKPLKVEFYPMTPEYYGG